MSPIVTFDSDLHGMTVINGHCPKFIWIRTGSLTTLESARVIVYQEDAIESDDATDLSCLEMGDSNNV